MHRHLLMRTGSLFTVVSVNVHETHTGSDFTLELNMIILVARPVCVARWRSGRMPDL